MLPPTHYALLCCLPLLTATATAQFRIDEILVDPVGPNAGRQVIEIGNHGASYALDGFIVVTSANTLTLPPLTVSAGSAVLLHLGASGTNTATDLFFPNAAPLAKSDSITLVNPTSNGYFLGDRSIEDYVSFGGGKHLIDQATQVMFFPMFSSMVWPSTHATVNVPDEEGVTLARIEDHNAHSHLLWYVDRTPTLGQRNDHPVFLPKSSTTCYDGSGGLQHAGFATQQVVWALNPEPLPQQNLPWVGEMWELEVQGLPSTTSILMLMLGVEQQWYMPNLTSAPISFCMSSVLPLASTAHAFQLAPNSDTVSISIPRLPGLAGVEFLISGFVDGYAPSPGGLTFRPTGAYTAIIGSR